MPKDQSFELEEIIAEIKSASYGTPEEKNAGAFSDAQKDIPKHEAPRVKPDKSTKQNRRPVPEPEPDRAERENKTHLRAGGKDRISETVREMEIVSERRNSSKSFFPDEEDDEERRARKKEKRAKKPVRSYDFVNRTYSDPEEALSAIGKRIISSAVFTVLLFILLLCSFYLSFAELLLLPMPASLSFGSSQFTHLTVCLSIEVLAFFFCWDVTVSGFVRLFKGALNMDSLVFFSSLCSILHTLSILLEKYDYSHLPFTPVSVALCFVALASKRYRYVSLKRVYRILVLDAEPYAVKTFGARRSKTAFKTQKNVFPDMDALSLPDRTESFSLYYAPLVIVLIFGLAAVSSFGKNDPSAFLWSLSALSLMAVSPALLISSALPQNVLSRRLYSSGSAVINHKTAAELKKCISATLSDEDIFPVGSVSITSLKIGDDFSLEFVYSVAASVLEAVGGGIHAAFDNGARQIYASRLPVSDVRFYDSGGLSAKVGGRDVLCGTASFLMRMGVRVLRDVKLSNCIFFSVDSRFAGIFSLKYSANPQVQTAFKLLSRSKVTPLLAVRDFNLTQVFIEQKFKLRPFSTEFPTVEERVSLSENDSDTPPLAILTRSSLFSFAETIAACRRLKKTVNFNIFFSFLASVIGIGIMYFLTSNGEVSAASPSNILIYAASFTVPVWLSSLVNTAF